jgi:peroxiredoxin/predicted 2-oxoglutarate/Fe(II)-dependent dioxygenase YbiX
MNALESRPLSVGDTAPVFRGRAHTGEEVGSEQNVGHPTLVVHFLSTVSVACHAELAAFRDLYPRFRAVGVRLIGVSPDRADAHAALAKELELPFPLMSDVAGDLALAHGAAVPTDRDRLTVGRRTVLTDADQRVARIYAPVDLGSHAEEVLMDVEHLLREEPRDVVSHAPVLIIPNVLPPDVCRRLIDVWETRGNEDSGFMRQVDGRTVGMVDYTHKIRRDHFLTAGPDEEAVKHYVATRVVPRVQRAFNYDVTRREDFRIACYDAARGGYFRPHRDNTTDGPAHRRFAMSLLLNGDYEGGYLRFPEYGRHRYRPEAGGAVVFSCSLLHEATDVTAGRRFVLLSFFYGEREARAREEYNRRTGGAYKA